LKNDKKRVEKRQFFENVGEKRQLLKKVGEKRKFFISVVFHFLFYICGQNIATYEKTNDSANC